jgi:hypothetical protein
LCCRSVEAFFVSLVCFVVSIFAFAVCFVVHDGLVYRVLHVLGGFGNSFCNVQPFEVLGFDEPNCSAIQINMS